MSTNRHKGRKSEKHPKLRGRLLWSLVEALNLKEGHFFCLPDKAQIGGERVNMARR